jgi:toxin ParE1/3/4
MIVRTRAHALVDLDEIAEYIGRSNPPAAQRFLDAFDQTAAALAALPTIGGPHESDNPRLHDVRVRAVKRFKNHLIFYRPVTGGIEVLRVLYGTRDLPSALDEPFGTPLENGVHRFVHLP